MTDQPTDRPFDAKSARAWLEHLATDPDESEARTGRIERLLANPSLGFSTNGRVAFARGIWAGGDADKIWVLFDVNSGLSLGGSVEAPGTKKAARERAEAVAAIDFDWDNSRTAVGPWRSTRGTSFFEEMLYAAGAADHAGGRSTNAARFFRSHHAEFARRAARTAA